jgi:hypothetical protein
MNTKVDNNQWVEFFAIVLAFIGTLAAVGASLIFLAT